MFTPRHSSRVYCSKECGLLQRRRIRGECEFCGVTVFSERFYLRRFCSNSCASRQKAIKRGKWVEPVHLKCTFCGKVFERAPSAVGKHQKLFFCSTGCNKAYSKREYKKKGRKKHHGLKIDLRFSILMRDNFRCHYCGASAEDGVKLEVDHVISRFDGGSDDESNLVTSCKPCNQGKGARSATLFDPANTIPAPIWEHAEAHGVA
jgi:hypothetical protein